MIIRYTPNKRSVTNQKSVSTSQNEGFVKKYDFTGPKNCFHSNQFLRKFKKMVSNSRNYLCLNIGLPFKKRKKERKEKISFLLNKKSVATGRIKELVQKIHFHEMEKLLPMVEIFQKLEQNGFH